ncbi:hypothetical protein COCSADRAFT_165887 [Bipolaris sorokiniana ND90Pr]|uniref:Uncharacterized protein n=1 Tax=Cochliobolus sativus (strain ND90Pr / ATCC 201652) TaxID=665912 RepID=M2SLV3_COCSN|nr:uncharacterized protein COCSADRAFT_165887 [Bipolaris sorokiniana ND90Pr]EMD58116.1 hypothetical protein COCSADRAFT_165887 [Bipolaris sorokiniana ND90Pr]
MQRVKRRLCIMVLLAKDLLARLDAYFHQCKSLLAASLRLQREGEISEQSIRKQAPPLTSVTVIVVWKHLNQLYNNALSPLLELSLTL